MLQDNLFDLIKPPAPAFGMSRSSAQLWTPEPPPSLDGIREIQLNVETTGLRWWEKDRPIAVSLRIPDGHTWYLPWGHRPGGNLDEETVKRWALRELRGKRITNINTRFDVHMMRVWGVDLEEQGNEVSDVGHSAALLDDHRKRSSLDFMAEEFFGAVEVPRLDESRMAEYHAGEAERRARYNVELVARLQALFRPQLEAQDLLRVHALEDQVIYVVCEMEKNGTPIDLERLDRWEKDSERRLNQNLLRLGREFGFQVNPDSNKDMQRVFEKLKIPIEYSDGGGASFAAPIIKRLAKQHPLIDLIAKTGKLIDLRTKYLVKYKSAICSDGKLRYALHQLRAVKDSESGSDAGEAGTITGRFSSTELVKGVGKNIQQEMKVSKQRAQWGYAEEDDSHDDEIYVIRKLHVPETGDWLSADAMQIEYRLFACYANNPAIIKAYEEDPLTSFHNLTLDMIREYKPDQTYKEQKDLNFANIYGAATIKVAVMLGYITHAEGEALKRAKDYKSPKLAKAILVKKVYDRVIPEAAPLLKMAAHLARPECTDYCRTDDKLHRQFKDQPNYGHRGYVMDLLGRRCRFPDGQRSHKALNSIVQPGAATINKQKLVELHRARKYTGFLLRFTVHDEVDGDSQTPETPQRVSEILNRQSFPELKIPITWDVAIGPNWADVKEIEPVLPASLRKKAS